MVRSAGVEPTTLGFGNQYSIQLSYERFELRTGARFGEECLAFVGIMAELMAEDAKGAGRIGEALRHFGGRKLLDEESAERLVLALARGFGVREEESGLAIR